VTSAGEPGSPGVVAETVGGIYRILLDTGQEVEAFLRGRLKREARTGDRVVPGDRVLVVPVGDGEGWVVESVTERETELVRSAPGGRRAKVVAANVERVFVVVAAARPSFRSELVDRFLVLAESCRIPAVLVVNKMDLAADPPPELEDLLEMYRRVDYPVLRISAHTGAGLDELSRGMEGQLSTFIGPSGAGKSSILNALFPDLGLRTGTVDRRRGRGRHTTVSPRLVVLDGDTRVIDTPGFSDVTAWGVDPGTADQCFPELRRISNACRFRGCSHLHEPDCAVREAVESGEIDLRRYESYRVLAGASEDG
jgi:ribosome biogenesis GTPase / thiamine phosphate phosphatase